MEDALTPFSSFRKRVLKVFFLLNFEAWFGSSEALQDSNEKFRRKKTFIKLFQAFSILYPRSNTYTYSLYVIENRPIMPLIGDLNLRFPVGAEGAVLSIYAKITLSRRNSYFKVHLKGFITPIFSFYCSLNFRKNFQKQFRETDFQSNISMGVPVRPPNVRP